MTTEPFIRETSRTFVVAPDFPVVVTLCGYGTILRNFFRYETEQGKICITLSEKSAPELNTNKIALADELFIINPDGMYDDFQAAMLITAERLEKHIRVLKD